MDPRQIAQAGALLQAQEENRVNAAKEARERYIYSFLHSVTKELYCHVIKAELNYTTKNFTDEEKLRGAAQWARKAATILGETLDMVSQPCSTCLGCGRVASDDERTPWCEWEKMPEESQLAMKMGVVRPLNCPDCGGKGHE